MTRNDLTARSRRARTVEKVWGILPILLLILVVVVIVGLFGEISQRKARIEEERANAMAAGRPAANVILLEMVPGRIRDRLNLPGVIEPWTDLTLSAKLNGSIIEVPVREGDRIEKGGVIARVDPADYLIALDGASSAARLAAANLTRTRALHEKGLTPQADLEYMETQVDTTRAALKNAELLLSRCTITSPMAGVMERLDAKVGLLLNIGDPIARILEIDRVKAVVGIPESDANAVRGIEQVELTLNALGDRRVTGNRLFMAASAGSFARLYNLELAVENPDLMILPGMFVRAELVKKTVDNSLVVPIYAVLSRNNQQFVMVDSQGRAVRRRVKLGILDGWRVEVVEGLQAGDRVIVEGHRAVEEGQELNIIKVIKAVEELTS